MGNTVFKKWHGYLLAVLSFTCGLGAIAAPQIVTPPTNQTVALGSNATFNVVATDVDRLSYQWFLGATPLGPTSSSPSLTLTNVQFANCGTYSVTVTVIRTGAKASASATLSVMYPPDIVRVQDDEPCPHVVNVGDSIRVVTTHSAGGPYSIQWRLDGVLLSNWVVAAAGAPCTPANLSSGDVEINVFPTVGDHFLEVAVSNAVGRATRLYALQAVPSNPGLLGGFLPASPTPGSLSCGPSFTLTRGLPGVYSQISGGAGCDVATTCGTMPQDSSWYRLVSLQSGTATVSTEGSSSDTVLAIMHGPPISCLTLTNVKCNRDVSGTIKQSRVQFQAAASNIYFIAVSGLTFDGTVKLTYGYEPAIASASLKPGGVFELRSTVAPSLTYSVQASSNMAPNSWTTVFTANAATNNGVIVYREANITSRRERFFRLAPGP
jgi:hypothetical protein